MQNQNRISFFVGEDLFWFVKRPVSVRPFMQDKISIGDKVFTGVGIGIVKDIIPNEINKFEPIAIVDIPKEGGISVPLGDLVLY